MYIMRVCSRVSRWVSIASIVVCLAWMYFISQYRHTMADRIVSMNTNNAGISLPSVHPIQANERMVMMASTDYMHSLLQTQTSVLMYIYVPGVLQQNMRQQVVQSIPSYHKYHSQILFINDYISITNAQHNNQQQHSDTIQHMLASRADTIVLGSATHKHNNTNSNITDEIVQTNRYQLAHEDKVMQVYTLRQAGKSIGGRYTTQCAQLYGSVLDVGAVRHVHTNEGNPQLYYSPQLRDIVQYDTNNKIRTRGKQLKQWLHEYNIRTILLPQLIEEAEQSKLIQLIITLALHSITIPIMASPPLIKKIYRNMVINDLHLHTTQIAAKLHYQETILLSTPSLLLMDIISLRKLIISQSLKIVIYLDTPDPSALDDIRREFLVTPIHAPPEQHPQKYAEVRPQLYLVQRIRNKVNSQKVIEQENRPNYKFILEPSSALSPKWISATPDVQTYPEHCRQLHPVVSKYFPTNSYSLDSLFQLVAKQYPQQSRWTFYYCLSDVQLLYQIGMLEKTEQIVLCSEISGKQLKLLIKIAIINDFGGKVVEQDKQSNDYDYDVALAESRDRYQMQTSKKDTKLVLKSKQPCLGTKIGEQLCVLPHN